MDGGVDVDVDEDGEGEGERGFAVSQRASIMSPK